MGYIFQNFHWFVLLIGALVFFHELGHFLVAKACNTKVLRFSLGFGPRLLSFTRGETEYQISLLPLGGYVKMLGDVPGSDIPAAEANRAFSNKSVWQRALIVTAGPVFNMILATAVYFFMFLGVHTFGDTRLGIVTVGEPAYEAGLRPGDKITAVEGAPVVRWEDLREQIANHPDASLRLRYERAGQSHEVQLTTQTRAEENAFQETESRGKIGISLQYLKPILGIVDPGSPAALAGLKTDDVITFVGDQPVLGWHEVRNAVAQYAVGKAIGLTVKRAGNTLKVELHPTAPLAGLDRNVFSSADPPDAYSGLVNKDSLVAKVEAGTPAAKAGLQVGDRLLGITIKNPDGKQTHRPVGVWGVDLSPLGLDARSEMLFFVQRGNSLLQRSLRLQERDEKDDFKNVHTALVLGATNDPDVLDTYTFERSVGAWEAMGEATHQVREDMTLIGKGIGKMIRGTIPLNTMGGPIMLFVIAEKSAKRGWTYYFRTMAMISVNLGMLNMLPVPVLDGGHLLFCGIEAVSRRPPSLRVRELANMVGLGLLLLLMALVFRNDFLRFVLQ